MESTFLDDKEQDKLKGTILDRKGDPDLRIFTIWNLENRQDGVLKKIALDPKDNIDVRIAAAIRNLKDQQEVLKDISRNRTRSDYHLKTASRWG